MRWPWVSRERLEDAQAEVIQLREQLRQERQDHNELVAILKDEITEEKGKRGKIDDFTDLAGIQHMNRPTLASLVEDVNRDARTRSRDAGESIHVDLKKATLAARRIMRHG